MENLTSIDESIKKVTELDLPNDEKIQLIIYQIVDGDRDKYDKIMKILN